MYISRYFSG